MAEIRTNTLRWQLFLWSANLANDCSCIPNTQLTIVLWSRCDGIASSRVLATEDTLDNSSQANPGRDSRRVSATEEPPGKCVRPRTLWTTVPKDIQGESPGECLRRKNLQGVCATEDTLDTSIQENPGRVSRRVSATEEHPGSVCDGGHSGNSTQVKPRRMPRKSQEVSADMSATAFLPGECLRSKNSKKVYATKVCTQRDLRRGIWFEARTSNP